MTRTRPFALIAAVAIISSLLVVVPWARATEVPEEGELISRSTYGNVYRLADGSKRLMGTTEPINFQDANGLWHEIDNTLVSAGNGRYRNLANEFHVTFGATGAATELLTVEFEGKSLSFGLQGAADVIPTVSGADITYPEILPNADLTFQVRGELVKELLVLKEPPTESGDWLNLRFPMSTVGLSAQEVADTVLLDNSIGQTIFSIPHLFMYDSSGTPASGGEHAFSENISLAISTSAGGPSLDVKVDAQWLRNPARVYPVTIDPSPINDQRPTLDTFVQSGISGSQAGSNELKSGYYTGAEGTFTTRSLLKFDLDDIAAGSTIQTAKLQLMNNHSYACAATPVEVRRVDSSWDSNVNWANKPALAANAADTLSFSHGNANCSPNNTAVRKDFNVQSVVDYWKNTQANNLGFAVRAVDEGNVNQWKKFASDEATHKPWIDVTWTEVDNTGPGSPTISGTSHALDAWSCDTTADFSWNTPNDPSGIAGYWYALDQSSTSTGNSVLTNSNSVSNLNAASPGHWWFHVRAKDGAGNWGDTTRHHHFQIDTTPPSLVSVGSTSHPSGEWGPASGTMSFQYGDSESGIAGYSHLIDTGSTTTVPDNTSEGTSTSTSFGPLGTGDHTFHVKGKNGAGCWAPSPGGIAHYGLKVDATKPPTPTVASSSHPVPGTAYNNNDVQLTWSSTDLQSGTTGYSYAFDQSPSIVLDKISEGTATSITYNDKTNGTWYFHVSAKDAVGNWSDVRDFQVVINFDDSGPSAPSITTSSHPQDAWSCDTTADFSWSTPSDPSGIAGYWYALDQSSTSTGSSVLTNSNSVSNLNAASSGDWWFHVRAKDGAGNWSDTTRHHHFKIDTTPPSLVSVGSTSHPSGEWGPASGSMNFVYGDLESGVNGYSHSIDALASSDPGNSSQGTSTSMSFGPLTTGNYTFHVKAKNNAGCWSSSNQITHYGFKVDATKPGTPTVSSSSHPTQGNTYASNDVALSWTATDLHSGVGGYSYVINQSALTTPDTTPEGTSTSNSYADLADGTWWFHVRAKDGVGNWGDPDHFQIVIDVPAPVATFSLNGPADQTNPEGEPVVRNGNVITISGDVREGLSGAPLDRLATIRECRLVTTDDDSIEVATRLLTSSECRLNNGILTGSVVVSEGSLVRGWLAIRLVVERGSDVSSAALSNEIAVDNDVPSLDEAIFGCTAEEMIVLCSPDLNLAVSFSEEVRGEFLATEFAVEGSVVLGLTSDCTASSFCDGVVLKLAAGGAAPEEEPVVSYVFSALGDRTRARDGAGNVFADAAIATTADDDEEMTIEPALPIIDPQDPATVYESTPAGEVLVLTVNTLQATADEESNENRNAPYFDRWALPWDDANCPSSDLQKGSADYKEKAKCNANGDNGREELLADRVRSLLDEYGETDSPDAMPYAPDVILLQEARKVDAQNIASYLNGKINMLDANGEQTSDVFVVGKAATNRVTVLKPGSKKATPRVVRIKSTAILYNKQTMSILQSSSGHNSEFIDLGYGRTQQVDCPDDEENASMLLLDADLDGFRDCRTRTHRRNYLMGFAETAAAGATSVGVASIHFPDPSSIKGSDHDEKARQWAGIAANTIANEYPTAARAYLGGDFNIERCVNSAGADPEPIDCDDVRPWYEQLTAAPDPMNPTAFSGYEDLIYQLYGDDQEEMDLQYRDGASSRERRIDFLFSKELTAEVVETAPVGSHDITCGSDDANPDHRKTCEDLRNSERYSDHRLVWGYYDVPVPDPSPTISASPTISPIPTPSVSPPPEPVPGTSPVPIPSLSPPVDTAALLQKSIDVNVSAEADDHFLIPSWYTFDWECEAIALGFAAVETRILQCDPVDLDDRYNATGASPGNRVVVTGHVEDASPFESATDICWMAQADFADGSSIERSGCTAWDP